ncbi:MAG: glycosyltransferase [bacterium]
MLCSGSVTVVVLSAGQSGRLEAVLRAATDCVPPPDVVECVWSGLPGAMLPIPGRVRVVTIPAKEFDHGATRQAAVARCTTSIVAFLSDDAEPADSFWLAALVKPFHDPRVAAVFGRQLPRPEAELGERIFRLARYPDRGFWIDAIRIRLGRRAMLPLSDANAAYRVSALKEVGGFPRPCSFGEDQVAVARLLTAGWTVHYVPEAAVWHSHNHSWKQLVDRGRRTGLRVRKLSSDPLPLPVVVLHGSRLGWDMIRAGWRESAFVGVALAMLHSGLRAVGYVLGWVIPSDAD